MKKEGKGENPNASLHILLTKDMQTFIPLLNTPVETMPKKQEEAHTNQV